MVSVGKIYLPSVAELSLTCHTKQISSQVFYGGGHQELDGDFYQDDISLAGLVAKDVDIFSVTKAVGSDLLAM